MGPLNTFPSECRISCFSGIAAERGPCPHLPKHQYCNYLPLSTQHQQPNRSMDPGSGARTWTACLKPVRSRGRKTPVMATWSPGWVTRVFSPRAYTAMLLGMLPTGTWSLCSHTGERSYVMHLWLLYLNCTCNKCLDIFRHLKKFHCFVIRW